MRFGIALSQERSSSSSFSLHESESERPSLQTLSPHSDSGNEPISGIPGNADIFGFDAMESPPSESEESPSISQTDMLGSLVDLERVHDT